MYYEESLSVFYEEEEIVGKKGRKRMENTEEFDQYMALSREDDSMHLSSARLKLYISLMFFEKKKKNIKASIKTISIGTNCSGSGGSGSGGGTTNSTINSTTNGTTNGTTKSATKSITNSNDTTTPLTTTSYLPSIPISPLLLSFLRENQFVSLADYMSSKILYYPLTNTLQHVLVRLSEHLNQKTLTEQEVRDAFRAYLFRNTLLNEELDAYIEEYWRDIIIVVQENFNPPAVEQEPVQNEFQIYEEEEKDVSSRVVQNPKKTRKNRSDQRKINEEIKMMESLKKDPSLLAYQIACYIYYIMERYDLKLEG